MNFYDEKGNETIDSKIGYAIVISDLNFGRNTLNLNPDFKTSCSLLDEYLLKNRQKKEKLRILYPVFLLSKKDNKVDKELTISLMEKEMVEYLNHNDLTDKEYKFITEQFKRFRMMEKAEEAAGKAISKYPKGLVAFSKQVESLSLDTNLSSAVERIDKEYPAQRKSRDYYNLIIKILEEKKPDYLKELFQKNSWLFEEFSICSLIITQNLTEEINYDRLYEINEKYIELAKKEYEKPISERENTVSEKQEIAGRRKQYAYSLFIYGETLSRLERRN